MKATNLPKVSKMPTVKVVNGIELNGLDDKVSIITFLLKFPHFLALYDLLLKWFDLIVLEGKITIAILIYIVLWTQSIKYL